MCLLLKSTVYWIFFFFFFPHVEKWNVLIMHDSWAPVRRREGEIVSVYARGCSESHSFSLGLMFGVLFVRVHVYVCTCVWWKDWREKKKKKNEAHSSTQLAISNQLTQTLPQAFWTSISHSLPPFLSIFFHAMFFAVSISFPSFSSSFFYSTCYPSSGLPPSSPAHSVSLLWLLCSRFLHIFPYLPVTPPPLSSLLFSPSLPLWLSSSDRLLMQALHESISPSAVVELASLLSSGSLHQSANFSLIWCMLVCLCRCVQIEIDQWSMLGYYRACVCVRVCGFQLWK